MENLQQLEEFKNRVELLYNLKKERLLLKRDMNILMDDIMTDKNVLNNMSRNHLLKVLINKLDNLNNKIKIIESNFICY
jgi:hypothetical protein